MYPTKKEILKSKPRFKKKLIEIIQNWKKEFYTQQWSQTQKDKKREYIEILLTTISLIIYNKYPLITHDYIIYCYNPKEKKIFLGKNISIISSLHELAHFLFGSSELKACRWSIWLFKENFPKEFKKLQWEKHTLIKK